MRPYRVLLRGQGVFFAAQSSADCITNMSGFDLRQAQVTPGTADRPRLYIRFPLVVAKGDPKLFLAQSQV